MSDTIIGAPFESHLRSVLAEHADSGEPENLSSRGMFKIRAADSEGRRSSARILVNRMYASRGYHSTTTAPDEPSNRITLVASDHDETIGTLSISFDGDDGLLVDQLFAVEADALRAANRKLCEFTKLAVDPVARSKRVLASLFHVAYIVAFKLKGFDLLLIEVNPRHVRYYERMLGFEVIGSERLNLRVNAPAVLLCLDFRKTQQRIGELAATNLATAREGSLYPYFFSVAEEAGIVGRLQGSSGL
jgi:N-acetylglutamate synthase-like GNAT family acetyltransferase